MKKRFRKYLISSLLILTIWLCPFIIWAETLSVEPTQDIRIYQPNGGANDSELGVISKTNENQRSLFKFDFTSLPDNATITTATLKLYYFAYSLDDPVGRNYYIYRLTNTSWTDSGTWTKYNGVDDWTLAGGDFTTDNGNYSVVPASYGWMTWDITDMVDYFQLNSSEIADLILKDSVESQNSISAMYSSTAGSFHPQLVIDYTLPEATSSDEPLASPELNTFLIFGGFVVICFDLLRRVFIQV